MSSTVNDVIAVCSPDFLGQRVIGVNGTRRCRSNRDIGPAGIVESNFFPLLFHAFETKKVRV